MAITPTVLIAAKGMLNNEGVGVNTDMTTQMSAATGSPITSNLSQLQAQAAVLALTDPVSAAAILATLPGYGRRTYVGRTDVSLSLRQRELLLGV